MYLEFIYVIIYKFLYRQRQMPEDHLRFNRMKIESLQACQKMCDF